jgi:hypothetical protein
VTGTPGVQEPALFSFIQSDTSISGVTQQGQTFLGIINDVSITFAWTASDRSVTTYVGTLGSDAIMSGTWSDSNGTSGTWSAILQTTTQTTPASVVGSWNINYYTTSGTLVEGPLLITFTQSRTNLSGTTSLSGQLTTVTGNVSYVSILFYWTGSDGISNMFIGTVGAVGTGTMSGTWMSTSGKSGTWTATLVS